MGLSLFDPIQLFLMELNKSWTYNIQLYFNFYSTQIQLSFNFISTFIQPEFNFYSTLI